MRIYTLLLSYLLLGCFFVNAADKNEPNPLPQSPDSEIYLFDLSFSQGQYQLSNGINTSNNIGYDNQPFFTDNSDSFLFVSMQDGKQTDVYEYHLNSQKTIQLTHTSQNEYSPKSYDNNSSITYVNEGDNPYQTVWLQNRKTANKSWLLNSKEPVGYYAANAKTSDVLFWSRYGWSVQFLNSKHDINRYISGNALPSSPQQIPNSNKFSFVHRQVNSEMWIKAFNPKDFSITPIAPLPGSNYDYTWAPNGDILLIERNQLLIWPHQHKGNSWRKGQDLSGYFTGKAGRLSVSADGKKIALVENR